MTLLNDYPGACGECGAVVPALTGVVSGPPWRLLCAGCGTEPNPFNRDVELYPYQVLGTRWLRSRRRGLLGDQQGLGKTVQVLAALPGDRPALVVCPKVAKGVWARHVEWRDDLQARVIKSRRGWRMPDQGEVVVANYEQLPERPDGLPPETTVVLDEAHYAKNPSARRTLRARRFCRHALKHGGAAWGLTGTPLKNLPPDLWTLLDVLDLRDQTWGRVDDYRRDMGGRKGAWGWVWDGPVSPRVPEVLQRVMLRREKRDVLASLPPKRREDLVVDIDSATARAADEALSLLAKAGVCLEEATREALAAVGGAPFEALSRARAMLAAAKVPALLEVVRDHAVQNPGEPLLVWSCYLAPIDAISHLDGWAALKGAVSVKRRTALEDALQAGELAGLALTIPAGHTAITLTRAERAVFVDLDFSPSTNEQAEDRIHRIGQTRSVLYTRLVADHALDRRLFELLDAKHARTEAAISAARILTHPTQE